MSDNKILLCAMCKMENNYLGEWVSYHLNIGFDKIVIIDNNDTIGSYAENIMDVAEISEGVSNGSVEIYPLNNGKYLQQVYYNKVYEKYKNEFDWFCFLDIDEFLTLTDTNSVKEFVQLPQFKDFNAIRICWKCYGDNDLITVDGNYSVLDRFVEPSFQEDSTLVKTIFRSFGDEDLLFVNSHGPTAVTMKGCNTNGRLLNTPQKASISRKDTTYEHAYIKHFITKTLEEYINKKMVRGGSAQSQIDLNKKYNLSNFFRYNIITDKHIEFLKNNGFDSEDFEQYKYDDEYKIMMGHRMKRRRMMEERMMEHQTRQPRMMEDQMMKYRRNYKM